MGSVALPGVKLAPVTTPLIVTLGVDGPSLSEPQAARMAAAIRVSEAFSAVDLLGRMGRPGVVAMAGSSGPGRGRPETRRTLGITHDGSVSPGVKDA